MNIKSLLISIVLVLSVFCLSGCSNEVDSETEARRILIQSISDISEHEFYKEYQLWRNIIYAKKGNVFFCTSRF